MPSTKRLRPGADGNIRAHIKFRDLETRNIHNTYFRSDWQIPEKFQGEALRERLTKIYAGLNCELLAVYAVSDEVIDVIDNKKAPAAVFPCIGCPFVTNNCEETCDRHVNNIKRG